MRSQYSLFDVMIVGITVLISSLFLISFHPNFPDRYLINKEYYIVETLLMERNGSYIFEQVRYGNLNKNFIKRSLDKMVSEDYYYIFEIPEYGFRVTNFKKLNSIYKCVQLEKIYPVNEKFGNVHIIFGIWKKDEKMRVINCGR